MHRAVALGLAVLILPLLAADWPQFRGPKGRGLAGDAARLPVQIGPDVHQLWKVPLPPGHSSPIVVADRIYVTAVREQKLLTIALDARTGKVLWEREAPHRGLETIHRTGSYAQSTPACDGEVVVSFFGSSGLWVYDTEGKPLWNKPYGPFANDFGAGASPILHGNCVILNQDHDQRSFLTVLDKTTGREVWTIDRKEFPRSYATPVIWTVAGKPQIVIAGTLRVVGYDRDNGKEIWTVRKLSRIVNMTPTVGPDNVLIVPAWSPGGDEGSRMPQVPPFEDMVKRWDANKNGTLEADEVPDGPIKERFTQVDLNKDGHIDAQEFERMRRVFNDAVNRMIAIKPGGQGDLTETHVLWQQTKALPYVPSPVIVADHLYMVKNLGVFTSVDLKTGQAVQSERVYGKDEYYASPVAGDGKIYLISQKGKLSVVSAEPKWKLLHKADFGEETHCTPALANGRVFLRTVKHLYCFAESAPAK